MLDLPIIFTNINKSTDFKYDKKRKTKSSIWPTTFPTSTISVRKDYLRKCIKFQKNKFENLEIDFRLCCLFSIIGTIIIYFVKINLLQTSGRWNNVKL